MFKIALLLLALFAIATAQYNHLSEADREAIKLNTTTGGPYTYEIKKHHFYGTAWDGSWMDTTSACSGYNNSCRNNPDCTCKKNEGPLPPGTYTIG